MHIDPRLPGAGTLSQLLSLTVTIIPKGWKMGKGLILWILGVPGLIVIGLWLFHVI